MMDKSAFQYLADNLGTARVIEVGGRQYSDRKLHKVLEPEPAPLRVTTLSALVEYVSTNPDGIEEPLLARVESPTEVVLSGPLFGPFQQRKVFLKADCGEVLPVTRFGQFMDQESFIIMLRSGFLNADALAGFTWLGQQLTDDDASEGDLEYVGSVAAALVDEASANHQDDGITQTVTLQAGTKLKGVERLQNPVRLRPWRTFPDVRQPMSEFVLRVRKGGLLGLFEADGGAWRLEAMNNIQAELKFRLAEAGVKNIQVIA